uniref:Uncharacterized protein n=1 Tax=Hucho hucho TaxID=62062 RepID=A0A4W5R215_9TELE
MSRSAEHASIPPHSSLPLVSRVSPSLLLAARKDQSYILPVKAGESTAGYKVLMGGVPFRGGRPREIEAPTPMWEGRIEGGGRWHGGGCGGLTFLEKRGNKTEMV